MKQDCADTGPRPFDRRVYEPVRVPVFAVTMVRVTRVSMWTFMWVAVP